MVDIRHFNETIAIPTNPAPITQPPIVQATYKDAKGQTTIFETDAIGRVTKQIDPLNRTTTITRDPQDNLLTSTEQAIAATTSFTYEPAFNQVTRFFCNAQGLLTETRDALYPTNPATTFTYDALGRLLTTTDPWNRTTTLTYDNAGNIATSTDALSHDTTFTYDPKNRLREIRDTNDGRPTYTYAGRLFQPPLWEKRKRGGGSG